MPEQAGAANAADSKEAHTDIHQAPNVSHIGEVATADGSSVVQCGEGPCGAGGSAASARFRAGEVMRSTAADLHPCKTYIVMMPDNLCLYPMERSFCGGSSSDLEVLHEGSAAAEWPCWYGVWHGNGRPPWDGWHSRSAELLHHLAACGVVGAHKQRRGPWSDCTTGPWS